VRIVSAFNIPQFAEFTRGRIVGMLEAGMTGTAVARRADCDRKSVRRWESVTNRMALISGKQEVVGLPKLQQLKIAIWFCK